MIEPSYKFNLVRESFLSISRGIEALESGWDSSRVYQRVTCLDFLDKYGLYKFHKGMSKKKKNDRYFEEGINFDELEDFIKVYFDFMLRPKECDRDKFDLLGKTILKLCAECSEKHECLDIFISRILPIFKPSLINKSRKLEYLYKTYKDDLIYFIENYVASQSDKYHGWCDDINEKNRAVDAFLTARILKYIYLWHEKRYNYKLELKTELNYKSPFYNKCIESIQNLQITDIEKTKETLRNYGIGEKNIKESPFLKNNAGGWFGKYVNNVWQIKVRDSARIAIILNQIDGGNPICKEIINKTKRFIDDNFCDKNFLIDYASGQDYEAHGSKYNLRFSDIAGTIEATNFYIEIDTEIGGKKIHDKIQWIIDQQLPTGEWPIVSKELFNNKDFLEKFPNQRLPPPKENKSISNTIRAINVITNFLLRLHFEDKETERKKGLRI